MNNAGSASYFNYTYKQKAICAILKLMYKEDILESNSVAKYVRNDEAND